MNIDQPKVGKIQEAIGWLKQAENHHRWGQHEISDDCVKRAKAALADPVFDRQPIAGFARNEQPEVIKIKASNPLGYAIVNGSDYDPETMELYKEPTSSKRK